MAQAEVKEKKDDPLYVDPLREAFEAHVRRINPEILFVKRNAEGEYVNMGIESMWQGFLLGYTDGLSDGRLAAKK